MYPFRISLVQQLISASLKAGSLDGRYEKDADQVATQFAGASSDRISYPEVEHSPSMEHVPVSHPVLQRLGSGSPLPPFLRAFFEPHFGYDFKHVRIHTGVQAAKAAQALKAQAFTLGHNIVFANGRYQPGTTAGNALLAHELTHVVQQGRQNVGIIQRKGADEDLEPEGPEVVPATHDDSESKGQGTYSHPLAGQGRLGSDVTDHRKRPLGNWESDNAVDIVTPIGTPVYTVADGQIGSQFGPLKSSDPKLLGLHLHSRTKDNEFYYAHLSAFAPGIRPGVRVKQGDLLGYSGIAANVPHLHLSARQGDPAALFNLAKK